ncbi:CapA family protein [Lachnospiraceae bacterium]|nr:CapA family protein [Lachnospiraceae bacterium]
MRNVDKIRRSLFVLSLCALLAAGSFIEEYSVRDGFMAGKADIMPVTSLRAFEERQRLSGRVLQKSVLQSAKEQAIQEILAGAEKGLSGNYKIEEPFLLWISKTYGRKKLNLLRRAAEKKKPDIESWYKITGKSLHVLWVEYCRSLKEMDSDLEKVYDKMCVRKDQIVLDFTGDINLSEGWSSTNYLDGQPGGIKDCFSDALWQEMQSADILMINNEFTYSTRGRPLPGKAYTFRADPERIGAVMQMGADIVSLANNHVWDYGEEALLDTLETVETAQIPYVGAGRNIQDAMKPVYFIANGRKIAIVSATQIERSLNYTKEATDETAGVLKTLNPDKFVSVIEQAKSQSDYVIAFVHWGTENTKYYDRGQVELGHAFIDAGADVIIGGHTHCLQGFDYYKGKPVIYSLGNFWFNNKTTDTGMSQVVIHTDSGEIEFRFLPCVQKNCVTSLVEEPGQKQRILEYMQRISAPGVFVDSDGFVTE